MSAIGCTLIAASFCCIIIVSTYELAVSKIPEVKEIKNVTPKTMIATSDSNDAMFYLNGVLVLTIHQDGSTDTHGKTHQESFKSLVELLKQIK